MQALFCSCSWSIGIEENNLASSEFPGYIWMFGGEFGHVLQVHWYPPSIMDVIQYVTRGQALSEHRGTSLTIPV